MVFICDLSAPVPSSRPDTGAESRIFALNPLVIAKGLQKPLMSSDSPEEHCD